MTASLNPAAHHSATDIHHKQPNKQSWLVFFDKFFLSVGATALALALVFYIAYNWASMSKIAKFTLVESALIVTVLAYVWLAYRHKFLLGQQLLLLVASIITGSLLALIGQVYQTGADAWQLFFTWTILIVPMVVVARLPALWLLWLALVNISVFLLLDTHSNWFATLDSQIGWVTIIMALLNVGALILWLPFAEHLCALHGDDGIASESKASDSAHHLHKHNHVVAYHWSTYVVGIVSVILTTRLGIFNFDYYADDFFSVLTFMLWTVILAYYLWRFYHKQTDILMLTCCCVSIITVVMVAIIEYGDLDYDAGSFLLLAVMLIGMSSIAITWLLRIHRRQLNKRDSLTTSQPSMGGRQSSSEDGADLTATGSAVASKHQHNSHMSLEGDTAVADDDHTPWYIQIFLGISGLLSGALVFLFVGMLFENMLEMAAVAFVVGSVLLGISLTLFMANKNSNAFVNSLSLSLSIAGQVFIVVGLFDHVHTLSVIITLLMVLQLTLLIIMPHFLHRLLSAFAALACLVWLLSYMNIPELSAALLAFITCVLYLQRRQLLAFVRANTILSTQKLAASVAIIHALALASAVMLLVITVFLISAENNHRLIGSYEAFYYHYVIAQTLLTAVCLYAAWVILQRYQISLTSKVGIVILGAVVSLGVVSEYVSGLLATCLVIVIGFANQKRLLLAFGIMAMVGYIFWYYYQLDTTLLVKSVSMLAASVVVFLIRWGLLSKLDDGAAHQPSERGGHA